MNEFYEIKTRPARVSLNLPARLPVSMNSAAHEGAGFEKICSWVDTHFKDVTIIIADTLQAHNMAGNRLAARQMGDQWLTRNQDALNQISHAIITRWDDWLEKPEYNVARQRVERLYKEDARFKSEIDSGVARFVGKHANDGLRDQFAIASKALLLEEAAVILADPREAVEFYPGSVPALKALGGHSRIKLVRIEAIAGKTERQDLAA